MTTTPTTLPAALDAIHAVPLADIPPAVAARVARRIVGRRRPKLTVAAFNSAI